MDFPRFLFIFSFKKEEISRSNKHYDNKSTNLYCFNMISLKTLIRMISLLNLLFLFSILMYSFINSLPENNKNKSNFITEKGDTNYDKEELKFMISNSSKESGMENQTLYLLRNVFLFLFNFFTYITMISSTFNLDEDTSRLGLNLYQLNIISHFILYFFFIYFHFTNQFHFINLNPKFLLPLLLLIFIVAEIYFSWLYFKFTYNIILGNDALVSGECFNKYVENLNDSRSHHSGISGISGLNLSMNSGTNKKNRYEEFKDDHY